MDLYNEFRPKRIEDMYPTSDLIKVLPQLIYASRNKAAKPTDLKLSHAMLFHAEYPGVGKTTAARLIAKALNPNVGEEILDAIQNGKPNPICTEINGGNLRKIDDARMIETRIESLRTPLMDDGYNYVFIIDEVHQLTDEAISCLLKPIENLPENVYVICTTTDLTTFKSESDRKKMGPAFLSRLKQYHFYQIKKTDFISLVLDITRQLQVSDIDQKVLDDLYAYSNGSVRNGIQGLDRYLQSGVIEAETVADSFTLSDVLSMYEQVVTDSVKRDDKKIVEWYYRDNRSISIRSALSYAYSKTQDVAKLRDALLRVVSQRLSDPKIYLGYAKADKRHGMSLRFLYDQVHELFKDGNGYPPYDLFMIKMASLYYRCFDYAQNKYVAPK